MMTMTELFYGPIEPTWIVHPQYPGLKRPSNENPYTIYSDDTYTCRRNPYMQRNAVPHTMVAEEAGQGVVHFPYQAQYFVHGGNGTNLLMSPLPTGNPGAEVLNQKQAQSPARAGVLQPRNAMNVQTVHFMVPLCCGKCEDRVKEQLLDLDDVQRVTCDQWKQKVTVTSSIAPEKLLTRLQKIKKRTLFWPQQQTGAIKVFNGNQVNGINQAQLQQNQKPSNDENQVIIHDETSSQQMDL